jgi:hypothetical protein
MIYIIDYRVPYEVLRHKIAYRAVLRHKIAYRAVQHRRGATQGAKIICFEGTA